MAFFCAESVNIKFDIRFKRSNIPEGTRNYKHHEILAVLSNVKSALFPLRHKLEEELLKSVNFKVIFVLLSSVITEISTICTM